MVDFLPAVCRDPGWCGAFLRPNGAYSQECRPFPPSTIFTVVAFTKNIHISCVDLLTSCFLSYPHPAGASTFGPGSGAEVPPLSISSTSYFRVALVDLCIPMLGFTYIPVSGPTVLRVDGDVGLRGFRAPTLFYTCTHASRKKLKKSPSR